MTRIALSIALIAFPIFSTSAFSTSSAQTKIIIGDDIGKLIRTAGQPALKRAANGTSALGGGLWAYRDGGTVRTYLVRDGKVRWVSNGASEISR